MTKDEAMAAIVARAPIAEFRQRASEIVARHPQCVLGEEIAYSLARWARANGTDEELVTLGMKRV